ncbi:MAG: DUF2079 domain-containing protein [Lentisphaerae bacterium]|nr:DUF2079 domain-containing protein [Lentisphaerota bacterium]
MNFCKSIAAVGWLLALTAAGLLMFSSYAAFSWKNYTLIDYGRYTQLLWNCGHGRLFGTYVTDTYLRTHLSFTLALLGPFFRIWDHPFLPSVLQWSMMVMGALMLAWTAGRRNVREDLLAAVVFFFVAYPLMQSAVMSGFHGITLSVLFIPWLYACLTLRKGGVILPLVLYAGLREDTIFLVVPMLLYFAVRDRWKAGYFWAAAGMVYAVVALFYLFPMFNSAGVMHARPLNQAAILGSFAPEEIPPRLNALFWLCLPAVFFLRKKGWIPLLVFPSAALLVAMFSPVRPQHALQLQYSATVFVLTAVAMVEAIVRRPAASREAMQAGRPASSSDAQHGSAFLAVALIVVTLAAHVGQGFLFGGRYWNRIYGSIHPEGRNLLVAARHIPREGVLICPQNLAGFCANRSELLSWKVHALSSQRVDLAFFTLGNLGERSEDLFYASLLNSREYGVIYFDGGSVILRRGADPGRNPEIFKARDAMSNRNVKP